jgi:BirA family biotin operon repressor/biotin-[acetyl-CoA-carboxylase] ligase
LQVVIGIGLNVGPALASTGIPASMVAAAGISADPAADVPRLNWPVASLRAADSLQPSRLMVLQQVLRELSLLLPQFAQSGFAPLLPAWQSLDAFRDHAVMLRDAAGRCVHGVSRGVDGMGALVLDTPQGEQGFVAGELSLRAAAGIGQSQ